MAAEHNGGYLEQKLWITSSDSDRELSISESISDFDNFLRLNEKSYATRASYVQTVKLFYKTFTEVTKENMILFKEREIAEHSPNTARLRVAAMNQYCKFLCKEEYIVNRVKIYNSTSVENVPTLQEYYYFLECLKKDDHMKLYWMLRFIAETGVRASELVRLEKSCLETLTFTMWSKGKIRKILIPRKLAKESKEYFKDVDSKYLFPSYHGERMQATSLTKMLKQYGKKYMVRHEILHAHAYRHLFAIQFLENSGDITLLSTILGHESVRTTAIYTMLSADKQRVAFERAVSW